MELGQQKRHIANSPGDVLPEIASTGYAKALRCLWHQLHKTKRSFLRSCAGFPSRLLLHDGPGKIERHSIMPSVSR